MPKPRILILGGSHFQVPLIVAAKAKGLYVITCDYLPQNPGHRHADEYHNVSTTDLEGILQLARHVRPDAVISYASDVSMQAAAYAAEQLGLPGNSYESIQTLGLKHRFRNLARQMGERTPAAAHFDDFAAYMLGLRQFQLPVMVKPVDSSGSKGVTRLDATAQARAAYDDAMRHSLRKRVIVEQFIHKVGPQIHGDGFVYAGRLVFACLGDHRFAAVNNRYTPVATTLPTGHATSAVRDVFEAAQRLIAAAGYANGPVNIEAMVDQAGEVYIMEIGPRNGGNYVPQLTQYATGADMIDWNLRLALGESLAPEHFTGLAVNGFYSHYILHSTTGGRLGRIEYSDELRRRLIACNVFKQAGDTVDLFTGSHCTLGVLLLKYPSRDDMEAVLDDIDRHVRVSVV